MFGGGGTGNDPASAEDEILQKACALAKYTNNDMKALQKTFNKYDKDKSGSLDIDEFYDLFDAKKSPFGDALFKLVELDGDAEFLDFSEFVSVVTTYALFGPEEVLRFAFNVVDEDTSGFVSLKELDNLAQWLHDGGPANLNTALSKIQAKYDKGDGNISFESFKLIAREYPFMLHPAFALQESMMKRVLGMKYWDKKRMQLGMVKDDDQMRAEKAKREGKEIPPGFLATYLPSIFGEGKSGDKKKKEDKAFGAGKAVPDPGPEMLAYHEFQDEVKAITDQLEKERKTRRKKARQQKAEAEEKLLALKRERMEARRARMLGLEVLDESAPPLQLIYRPAPVTRIFG
mmetsp:Transcript_67553/g.152876  ORF Transcript_67553/g.152876 Transcript_67553/m.152876 type:complete len:346 (-) Transcript_67553:264-1301(-)|eukprot:CAMPEP_0172592606 /NCGR_PEP_ID=MMETSP1068-20121228/11620_1 /TAXON_ID=35684 /ORGANISM="Pseudopedinella elastica, Strain CCMP716" /LENGTH=345 /DNA_ID=CAMNT_0013389685 /DNA_START=249 /DNA_END=1286 /DNA_ORIENTATION=+